MNQHASTPLSHKWEREAIVRCTMNQDQDFMREALKLAAFAASLGEVPVGAVLVLDGQIIGRGFNCPILSNDPSAHAEMVAIRHAAKRLGNYRLPASTLYVTLEPCSMCAGLLVHARVQRLVYGTTEPRAGMAQSQGRFFEQDFLNHRVTVEGGLLAEECAQLLRDFFKQRRHAAAAAADGCDRHHQSPQTQIPPQ